MKLIRSDKYFMVDSMNMGLGVLVILLGIITFIDLDTNAFLLPYILFIGGVINILNGSKHMIDKKPVGIIFMGAGFVCILGACISWMGFGGFL